jgi:hypothetical protein
MPDAKKEKPLTAEEVQKRFEAALKGALKTPHKPLKPAKATMKKSEPQKGNRK